MIIMPFVYGIYFNITMVAVNQFSFYSCCISINFDITPVAVFFLCVVAQFCPRNIIMLTCNLIMSTCITSAFLFRTTFLHLGVYFATNTIARALFLNNPVFCFTGCWYVIGTYTEGNDTARLSYHSVADRNECYSLCKAQASCLAVKSTNSNTRIQILEVRLRV